MGKHTVLCSLCLVLLLTAIPVLGENMVTFTQKTDDKPTQQVAMARDPFQLSQELINTSMADSCVAFQGNTGNFVLPRIKIKGVMVVGEEIAAIVDIDSQKDLIIKCNDTIVLADKRKKSSCNYIYIKQLTNDNLTILADGKYEFVGNFR